MTLTRPSIRSFTIVETVVAMGILALVLMAMLGAEYSGAQLRQTTRQNELITSLIQLRFAELRELEEPANVVALLDPPNSWIGGDLPSTKFNASTGVAVPSGIRVTASNWRVLSEAECAAFFGGSFDLDRDGAPNENGAGSDFANYETVVPVELTLTWSNMLVNGAPSRTQTFTTIIYPSGALQ